MLIKITQPTVTITLVCDLRGFVLEDGDLSELALRALPAVADGARIRIDLGRARYDTRGVIARAMDDPVIGWRRAADVELTGTDDDFLESVAVRFAP